MENLFPNGHNGQPAPDQAHDGDAPTKKLPVLQVAPIGATHTSKDNSLEENISSKNSGKVSEEHKIKDGDTTPKGPKDSRPKDPKDDKPDDKPDDKDPKHEQRLTLVVIVNTFETRVETNVHQPLHVMAQHALDTSGNAEYPLSEWTLTDDKGTVLDLRRKVEDYGFAPLTKLFLSKEVGAGGETQLHALLDPPPTFAESTQVDPQVTRAKFNEEVAKFRTSEAAQRARGILLLNADYPFVVLGFAAPRIQPSPLLFGVRIDFSEYDLRPLSLQFIDVFTNRPVRFEEIPTQFLKRNGEIPQPDANGAVQLNLQPLLMHHAPDGPPFLCVRGTREYHDHPAHTGDSWHLYRGTTVGTLGHLVDALYTYGINPLTGYQYNVHMALQADFQRIAS